MKKASVIFKIYGLLRALEHEAGFDELDLRARALLRLIGEESAAGRTLHVGEIVRTSGLGTAPTIYASLAELQAAGWIERLQDASDGRARLLQLAPRARKAFARMSRVAFEQLCTSPE